MLLRLFLTCSVLVLFFTHSFATPLVNINSPNTPASRDDWISTMSARLADKVPDEMARKELLGVVHDESKRFKLDPGIVLSLIDVGSGFKKHAVSSEGARGYMQVMPYWVKVIGKPEDNLFHMRTNLRYGCVIFRDYIDRENGNLITALEHYRSQMTGSVGVTGASSTKFSDTVILRAKTAWHY